MQEKTMGRKKIQISRIMDQRNRQVTFTKRKFGLMKKAYELSVLCDCEIALIIFNSTNRLFQYASTDMDKVLLKYTEYSEPHESRTNTDILETLRRKGLGLDGPDLDAEEAMQVGGDKYPLSEGMDLSVARQRIYASSVLTPEAQLLMSAGCENGYPNASNTALLAHRSPSFKPLGPRVDSVSPAGLPTHHNFMSPHSGIGYSVFTHGNLSRALEMKTPPPLNLGSDSRRMEPLSSTRPGLTNRMLYQSMHSANHMMAMGKGGYGLPSSGLNEYAHPGFPHAAGLQRSSVTTWQSVQHQEAHMSHLGMTGGGCFPSQLSTPTSPVHGSLNLSIKSERASPEHVSSPITPPAHHMAQHSPPSNPEVTSHAHQQPYNAMDRDDFQKESFSAQRREPRVLAEVKEPPHRQTEIGDVWQR
ncbi:myocyte-specific enhancer factor 2B [Denticeps clupeoides]|uniref:MADS-box domain-containing protein n=1 Tax=Denticeps clupeoides TaxID=299321 RepID=A0AAY4EFL0_9TELE|nr:myocyte-specific enhancer factor 2B [Denticeps clupeoides]